MLDIDGDGDQEAVNHEIDCLGGELIFDGRTGERIQ